MSQPGIVETADPETVFKALSDATRVDILLALWDNDDRTATFSALREAVGVADSGQFNYHLDKLCDRFVRKTDDGYELTLAGSQIVGAIHNGAYTMDGSIEPIDLDTPCPTCGADRRFTYEDETVRVECTECPIVATAGVSPGVFAGYDREQFPAVTNRYFMTIFQTITAGFCWSCDGQIETAVRTIGEAMDDQELSEEFAERPTVEFVCRRCGAETRGDPGVALQNHPEVAGFFSSTGSTFGNVRSGRSARWATRPQPSSRTIRHWST
jgi:RNase P subunit RPR2